MIGMGYIKVTEEKWSFTHVKMSININMYTCFVFSIAKNCVKICIQNMLKMNETVPGPVMAEVAVSVFSFVKDSYPVNPALFEEFENNDGYTVLQAIMARYRIYTTHFHLFKEQHSTKL